MARRVVFLPKPQPQAFLRAAGWDWRAKGGGGARQSRAELPAACSLRRQAGVVEVEGGGVR